MIRQGLKRDETVELMRRGYADSDWLEVREDSNEREISMEKRYEVRLVSWSENICEDENKDTLSTISMLSWLCAITFRGYSSGLLTTKVQHFAPPLLFCLLAWTVHSTKSAQDRK